ncbi:MAG TPA: hypothetical protein VMV10_07800 [Pirellulales bacterium]|nr:hypothetical protein [Pirellulales bacterium]
MNKLFFLALPAVLWFGANNATAQELGDDPLGEIAADMDRVVLELSGAHTGKPTQTAQKKIVGKLDVLIARLEEQAASSRGGASGSNPNRPLADSQIVGGPGGIGDLHAARKNGKQWGELPPHQRDKIVQSLTEGFPAHYQKILERYYKRLAEEKPAVSAEEEPDMKEDAPAGKENEKAANPKQPAAAEAAPTGGAK